MTSIELATQISRSITAVTSTPFKPGSVTSRNCCHGVAPSIAAASYSALECLQARQDHDREERETLPNQRQDDGVQRVPVARATARLR